MEMATLFLLVVASLACAYYFVCTVLPTRPSRQSQNPPRHRFAILIPAHNEESCIARTVGHALASDYPPELVRVVVVADNCSDRTATIANEAGATVLERFHDTERGKGYAIAYALAQESCRECDAVIVLDADCILSPSALAAYDAHLQAGEDVIQSAVVLHASGSSASSYIAMVGNRIENAVANGRDRLGWSNPLRGSGMCFRRTVLDRVPWNCFGLTEDAEYGEQLAAAGVRTRFDANITARGETPMETSDLCQQRRRWRNTLFDGRKWLLHWLHSKPMVLAQLLLTGLFVAATARLDLIGWYAGIVLLTCVVYLRAMGEVGFSWKRAGILLGVPFVLSRLVLVTIGGFFQRETRWQRTRRNTEPLGVR